MRPKLILAVLFFITLFDAIATGLFIPCISAILNKNIMSQMTAASDVVMGLSFLASLSPAYMLCAPIIGSCSDQFGRRRVMCYCLLSGTIGYALIIAGAHFLNLFLLLSGMMLTSISKASIAISLSIITDIKTKNQRTMYFGIISIATNTVLLFACFSAYLLKETLFFTTSSALFACLLLVSLSLGLAFFALDETRSLCLSSKTAKINSPIRRLQMLFNKTSTIKYLIYYILFQIGWGIFYQYLFDYLTQTLNFSRKLIQQINLSVPITLMLAIIIFLPALSRFKAPEKVLPFTLLIAGCSVVLTSTAHTPVYFWALIIIAAAGIGLSLPLFWSCASKKVINLHQGLLMGTLGTSWAIAWSISGTISFRLSHPSVTLPMICGGFIILLCALLTFVEGKR